MSTSEPVAPLDEFCGAHCGTDSRGTAHCPRCHAGACDAASPAATLAATGNARRPA